MLRIESLSINLGEFRLQGVSLEVKRNEHLAIIGPSGAGKTVLLETIAGLHTPSGGRIVLNGEEITRTAPRHRPFGIVYQDYMLFPHRTVTENIAFGLRQDRVPREERRARTEEIAALLEITHLADRYPGSLSGGEQQRVALARALILRPTILLLDEPLSALDGRTRERMRAELSRVRHATGTTIIQITHHFEDVFTLADRIAIMQDGRITQVGETEDVFLHPADALVADFLGIGNIIRGRALPSGRLVRVTTESGASFTAVSDVTGDVVATLHAEDVIISGAPFESSARNCLLGEVQEVVPCGSTVRVMLDVGFPLNVLLTRESCGELGLVPGSQMFATFKASAVHVIPAPR